VEGEGFDDLEGATDFVEPFQPPLLPRVEFGTMDLLLCLDDLTAPPIEEPTVAEAPEAADAVEETVDMDILLAAALCGLVDEDEDNVESGAFVIRLFGFVAVTRRSDRLTSLVSVERDCDKATLTFPDSCSSSVSCSSSSSPSGILSVRKMA
jgi:hypothetical protein